MITKLENGNTLITLGEGTVFTGNVYANDEEKPFGIYFSSEKGKSDDAVIIQMTSTSAVASYAITLIRFIEAWEDDKESGLMQSLMDLKHDLEPHLPKEKN